MTESLQQLDVLIVGAGFGGVYTLHQMRNLGFSVKIFESGSDLGGIWFWNRYPGARVDSPIPLYELSIPELWKDWTWTERFPGWAEIREYFQYMDSKFDLKKDIRFNSRVVSAHFDVTTDKWTVKTADGHEACARFLVLCTGFASKIYIPPIKGLDTFKGIYHHSSQWPEAGLDLNGKRVAVIGTGATGVQIIQEIGPIVEHLTVFQRTPNTCIPMCQAKVDKATQEKRKALYPTIFRRRLQTWGGIDVDIYPQNFSSASPEERHLLFEALWERGGFHLLVANYRDILADEEANNAVYAFWRDKVRERLNDPEMQERLAPTMPLHPFGAKRTSLEQNYYEIYNQPNVDLIDLQKNAITQITPDGIETSDGVLHQVDVIAFATGFDSITGGIIQIDIRGADGSSIAEKWKNGVHTYLGMTTANFPNMFFTYGPQAPTALSNGPTCIEVQGDWIKECLGYMKANNLSRIEASRSAEVEWRNLALANASLTLLGKAKSWYTGANIPGKPIEQLNLVGGIPFYDATCREKAAKRYEGFALSSDKSGASEQESKESKGQANGDAVANAGACSGSFAQNQDAPQLYRPSSYNPHAKAFKACECLSQRPTSLSDEASGSLGHRSDTSDHVLSPAPKVRSEVACDYIPLQKATTRKQDLKCPTKQVVRVEITVEEKTKAMTEAERASKSLQGYLERLRGTMDAILASMMAPIGENQFDPKMQTFTPEASTRAVAHLLPQTQ